jgi:putative RecB family exonuclease
MPRYSPLRFRVFDTCRLRYRYQYVDRVPARLRPADTAGSLVHRVLADFFTKVQATERTAERLLDLFDASWAALSPKYLRMKGVEALREQADRQLRRFAETADLRAEPLSVEPYFQVEAAPGITLFGRVDRIDPLPDGSLHLIDYKTSADADEVDTRQLPLYAIMAEESLGKPVSRLTFWYLDNGRTAAEGFTDEDRRRVRVELLSAIEQMESTTEFPAKVARHCGYCPYLHACAERQAIERLRAAEGW